jgi:hypothetical protein
MEENELDKNNRNLRKILFNNWLWIILDCIELNCKGPNFSTN